MNVLNKGRDLALRAGVLAVTAVPMLAMAEPTDPAIQAFADVETKLTTYGGLAFGVAVVGTLIWIGIDIFKKGAKKGAK